MVTDNTHHKRRFSDDVVDRILNAKTPTQIVEALSRTANGLEFPYFTVSYQNPTLSGKLVQFDNHPREWITELTALTDEEVLADPVLKHMSHSSMPLAWNQSTYTDAGLGHVWERSSKFGMKSGICLTIHGPHLEVLYIGFVHPQQKLSVAQSADIVGTLYLSGAAVLEQSRNFLDNNAELYTRALTAREVEILKWCHAGKTSWEIGKILSISETTVNFHIRNLVLKLDVTSKQQAVIRALRYRLI